MNIILQYNTILITFSLKRLLLGVLPRVLVDRGGDLVSPTPNFQMLGMKIVIIMVTIMLILNLYKEFFLPYLG